MDPLWLLLLLPTAAAGGWLMAQRERRAERRRQLPEAYFKGLSFLLNEQPDKALQVFLEVVEVDSETVEIHLALGNLFRRRGEIERATRIHQNLVARTDLEHSLREQALFELAQDYFKAGLLDRAEGLFQELRRAPDYRAQAGRFLLQIYDQEKEWSRAIAIAEELSAVSDADLTPALAQYRCELAEQAIADGRNESARAHIDAAFRHDAHCIRAVIQSGRLASMHGNHANAISIWRGLERTAPQALGEVVEHVANSYRALGDAKSYKAFLENALEHNSDARIIKALVELVSREREDAAGRELLVDLVRNHPSIEGLHALLKSRAAAGGSEREDRDFALLADLLSEVVGQGRGYHCRTCSFSSNALHWQCPGCKNWGTVQKRAPARGDSLRRPLAV